MTEFSGARIRVPERYHVHDKQPAPNRALRRPRDSFLETTYFALSIKDNTLDDLDLEKRIPLDNGRHRTTPIFDLGKLDGLPAELLIIIFLGLHLPSLQTFRLVSQQAMRFVDSLLQYEALVTHCPAMIRASLALEVASHLSLQTLYKALTTWSYQSCSDFGGYMYLLRCARVCFLCFVEEVQYRPLSAAEAKGQLSLERPELKGVPCMKSLKGIYSPAERSGGKRTTLYDRLAAHERSRELHRTKKLDEKSPHGSNETTPDGLSLLLVENSVSREPLPNRTRDRKDADVRRFMAIVRAPWFNAATKEEEWGFHCVGCRRGYDARAMHWRRKFCNTSFEEHVRECGPVDAKGQRHLSPSEEQSSA